MNAKTLFISLITMLALSGCTGRPLYAGGLTTDVMAPDGQLVSLRGRIAVSEAGNRTIQIVRNALLFRLNQGTRVSEPLYTVALSGSGSEIGIAVEPGGQAAASHLPSVFNTCGNSVVTKRRMRLRRVSEISPKSWRSVARP